MFGIFVILLVSWALLYVLEKKNLSELAHLPNRIRLSHFCLEFLFLCLLNLGTIGIDTMVYSIDWQNNPDLEFEMVLQVFWFHLKSTLTEELVFRGALLYILIERLGIKRGIVISSIVFGVYHWFTNPLRYKPLLKIDKNTFQSILDGMGKNFNLYHT
jgi:membrane protease YdiL (CAAX protease family)